MNYKIEENFNEALGKRLMLIRISKQMSQENLGAHIGVRAQQIHKYETGENRITPERLKLCSNYLDVSISYFYGEEDSRVNNNFDKSIINIAAEITELPRDVRQGVYTLSKIINRRYKREIEKRKKVA